MINNPCMIEFFDLLFANFLCRSKAHGRKEHDSYRGGSTGCFGGYGGTRWRCAVRTGAGAAAECADGVAEDYFGYGSVQRGGVFGGDDAVGRQPGVSEFGVHRGG